jgi:hypothetical protein
MQRSTAAKTACLLILVLFIVVCGVHLGGIHHDADQGGLGLFDTLSVVALVAALFVAMLRRTPRQSNRPRWAEPLPVITRSRRRSLPRYGSMILLRC